MFVRILTSDIIVFIDIDYSVCQIMEISQRNLPVQSAEGGEDC